MNGHSHCVISEDKFLHSRGFKKQYFPSSKLSKLSRKSRFKAYHYRKYSLLLALHKTPTGYYAGNLNFFNRWQKHQEINCNQLTFKLSNNCLHAQLSTKKLSLNNSSVASALLSTWRLSLNCLVQASTAKRRDIAKRSERIVWYYEDYYAIFKLLRPNWACKQSHPISGFMGVKSIYMPPGGIFYSWDDKNFCPRKIWSHKNAC